MPKNDSQHAMKMYSSLSKVNKAAAEEFMNQYPLSKSADYEKKFKWASKLCDFLEKRFDEAEIIQIRSNCNCYSGDAKAEILKGYLKKAKDLADFADIYNSNEKYGRIELDGTNLLLIYPTCYCSYVKRVDQPLSKTWCYCTLGYTKALFEKVFEAPVEAELLESVKTGGSRCVIKITRIQLL